MKKLMIVLAVIIISISGNLDAATEIEDLRTSSVDISAKYADKTTIQQLPVPIPKAEHQMKQFTFRSSGFSREKEAKESMDYAVFSLKRNGYNVISALKEFDYDVYDYTIVFTAPASIKIQRYRNLPYESYSEMKKFFERSLEYYKSLGLTILDQNLKRRAFVITVIK